MALKDWKKLKSKVYHPYRWVNRRKGLLLEIYYDIGFGKQRNVTIYNYKEQTLGGYQDLHTEYLENIKQALKFAKSYMREH